MNLSHFLPTELIHNPWASHQAPLCFKGFRTSENAF